MRSIKHRFFSIVSTLLIGAIVASYSPAAAAQARPLPEPAADAGTTSTQQTAVFAGGCYWGVQAVFEHVKGVKSVKAGFAGGERNTAEYERVSSGSTGHAESVKVTFDASKISYGQLLRVFFSVAHDPTELNRQGPDVGTQYRSAIFFSNEEQKRVAEDYISQLNKAGVFPKVIVTQVVELKGFYPAEDSQQDFALHNPDNPYIYTNDLPKVAALKKEFPALYTTYRGS